MPLGCEHVRKSQQAHADTLPTAICSPTNEHSCSWLCPVQQVHAARAEGPARRRALLGSAGANTTLAAKQQLPGAHPRHLPRRFPHLLHGVACQHTKHDRHARVSRGVEHARGGAAHHGVIMRGGAAHLRQTMAAALSTAAVEAQAGRSVDSKLPGRGTAARGEGCGMAARRPGTAVASGHGTPAGGRWATPCGLRASRALTTTPMQTTASYLPLLAMALATTGSSKLPGTQATCRGLRMCHVHL